MIDLAPWLERAVAEVRAWQSTYGEFDAHPVADGQRRTARRRVRGLRGPTAGQLPVLPPALRGPDAQAAAPGGGRRLPRGDADQSQQPRARRRPGDGCHGDARSWPSSPRCSVSTTHLGHLTSSGTIANLEALYVARETHPDRGDRLTAPRVTTRTRGCAACSACRAHSVPVDARGAWTSTRWRTCCARERIGTVVLTAGTTGLGAVDPIDEALRAGRALRRARSTSTRRTAASSRILARDRADGAGARPVAGDRRLRFGRRRSAQARAPALRLRRGALPRPGGGAASTLHDSPYTYFTSGELHLGEISLECSRAGASAAALWLTLRLLPLTPDGLGAVLAAGRRAAVRWAELIERSEVLAPLPGAGARHRDLLPAHESGLTARHRRGIRADAGARDERHRRSRLPQPPARGCAGRSPRGTGHRSRTSEAARIVRSVLMKPESETYLDWLHGRVERLAREAIGG